MGTGMAFYWVSDIQVGGAYPDIGLRRLAVRVLEGHMMRVCIAGT